jgi:hypothetical protein
VIHELGIVAVVLAKFGQIVTLVLTLVEQAGETRQAGVQRVAGNIKNMFMWTIQGKLISQDF